MKTASIFLNGYYNFDQIRFYRNEIESALTQNIPLICVDGGIHIFQMCDLVPTVLIGDLDSMPDFTTIDELKQSGVNVIDKWIGQTDKDYTDGQLAIMYALRELGCNGIIIYGGFPTSFDVDHFLGNLKLMRLGFCMSLVPSNFRAEMRDVFQSMYFVTSRLEIDRKNEQLQYISLIAEHGNVNVKSSTGLRWDVSNMWIDPDQPNALRNEFISEFNKVIIELVEGSDPVYVIHNW
jgi:thiamine pyrophosphokinase